MNKLTSMLPSFAQEYREFNIIQEAIISELDLLKEEQREIEEAQFIITCPKKYIHLWEESLGITDGAQYDLETRRINCIFKKNDSLPYNRKKVNDRIYSLVPKENCRIVWGKNWITVSVDGQYSNLFKVINKMLDDVLPLNMMIDVMLYIEVDTYTIEYYGTASMQSNIYDSYITYTPTSQEIFSSV